MQKLNPVFAGKRWWKGVFSGAWRYLGTIKELSSNGRNNFIAAKPNISHSEEFVNQTRISKIEALSYDSRFYSRRNLCSLWRVDLELNGVVFICGNVSVAGSFVSGGCVLVKVEGSRVTLSGKLMSVLF